MKEARVVNGSPAQLLRNGRIAAGVNDCSPADILISGEGRILDIGAGIVCGDIPSVDLGGRLVTPGFIDMHQHLDKSFTLADAPNPDGTLIGAIKAFGAYSRTLDRENLLLRAQATLDRCIAMGTCAIRTHANLDYEMELRSVEAMCDLRAANRDRVHLEVVAFATSSAARGDPETARMLLERAVSAGADCIGGTPNLAPDPKRYIDMLFEVAGKHGLPVDLHIDETLDPEARWFDYMVECAHKRGMEGRITGSHVSSLSALPDDEAKRSIEAAAAAGVAVCTLPAANLFLQGRGRSQLVPRGLTRVNDLLAAGVPVATASDNIQDAFVPVGSGDMLEMARWTILSAHMLEDAAGRAFRMITDTPASILGLNADYGLRPGARADLVVSRCESLQHLVAGGATERAVMHRGRLVAGTLA